MPVQFRHGNGVPAGSYRTFLHALSDRVPGLSVRAIERIGHDPHYPITDKWPHLSRNDGLDHRWRALQAASGTLFRPGLSCAGPSSLSCLTSLMFG